MKEKQTVPSIVVQVFYAAFLSALASTLSSVRISDWSWIWTPEVWKGLTIIVPQLLFVSLYFLDELLQRSELSRKLQVIEGVVWTCWIIQTSMLHCLNFAAVLAVIPAALLVLSDLGRNSAWKWENRCWLTYVSATCVFVVSTPSNQIYTYAFLGLVVIYVLSMVWLKMRRIIRLVREETIK